MEVLLVPVEVLRKTVVISHPGGGFTKTVVISHPGGGSISGNSKTVNYLTVYATIKTTNVKTDFLTSMVVYCPNGGLSVPVVVYPSRWRLPVIRACFCKG